MSVSTWQTTAGNYNYLYYVDTFTKSESAILVLFIRA